MTLTSGQIEKMRRDAANKIVISKEDECYYCQNSIDLNAVKCTICAFPQKGSQEEMRRFIWSKQNEKRKQKELQNQYLSRLKKAKWISFALGALFILGIAIETHGFSFFDPILYAVYFVFITSFFVSGALLMQHPKVCASVSLLLYLIWNVLQAISDPTVLYKGALLKVIFIGGLVYALREAFSNPPPPQKQTHSNILDDYFLSE